MRFFSLAIAFAIMSLSLAAPIPPISNPEPLGNGGAKPDAIGCVIECAGWKREE